MFSHIQKIREKPKAQRHAIQWGSTVAIMSVIVFVWVTSHVVDFNDDVPVLAVASDGAVFVGERERVTGNSPVTVLTATVFEAGKEIGEVFNQAVDVFVDFRDRNF
ncbi:hypothetical protein COB55_01715 [Candidatus Wolfebacteria bacterium]|nr:MAG: hypothetical protein COB55_01715 [Candidatus Wolfebacteria bacterium]